MTSAANSAFSSAMGRRLTTVLIAMLAGLLGVALTACGSDDANLLPGSDAQEILANLEQVEALASDGQCATAEQAIDQVGDQVEALPDSVSPELKENLARGVERLRLVTQESCGVAGTTNETETTPTTPETTETLPEEAPEGETEGDETGPTREQRGNRGRGGGPENAGGNRGRGESGPGGGGNADRGRGNAGGGPGSGPGGGGGGGGAGGGGADGGGGNDGAGQDGDSGGISPSVPVEPDGAQTP